MRETVIVAGALAQRPMRAGHTWVFLQYLLGFRALGFDVVFVDRLEPGMCTDAGGAPAGLEESMNVRYLRAVMERFGLADSWMLLYDAGRTCLGLPRERLPQAALLLNVMGYLEDEEILGAAQQRVFLDIDPGFGQMWQALGLADLFHGHDRYVTVGERIGAPGCAIPTLGIDWLTTKPPVVLDEWPYEPARPGRFTTVASWRGPFAPIEYEGRRYGLRVHELRRFAELPERAAGRFEIALDVDASDSADVENLAAHGWSLVDPLAVAGDPDRYRDYIRGSSAEVMIAKNMYVEAHSGWFSDRSACYLATGRPVLAQDTGLDGLLPTDAGVIAFTTLDEAVAGAAEVDGDYARHSRAAREIAREHFAADRVLPRLLAALGIA
jgi:hypothetical protein